MVKHKEEIGCHFPDCPLEAAIVVPLFVKSKVTGTFKLYFTDADRLTYVEEQLAQGLGNIFSSQLELGQMALEQGLLKDAEIKSLQAQVNPHFLFNAINTISALMRIDSEKARFLLLQLGQYFRSNITSTRQNVISVEEELNHLKAYLTIEQARFPDRFDVQIQVPEELYKASIPPFVIQILVENAFKHAFAGRKKDNRVWVSLAQEGTNLLLMVKDNGHGISQELMSKLGKEVVPSQRGTGSALENLNRRLTSLYGELSQMKIDSSNPGTSFELLIPLKMIEGEKG